MNLIVVAHPDDETISMGGLIPKLEATLVVMTDNYRSPDIYEHAKRAWGILGIKEYHLLNLLDSALETYTIFDLARRLENLNLEPDSVYTHYKHDLSTDHRLTFQAVMTAYGRNTSTSIYSFEPECSYEQFDPNYLVDISNTIDSKLAALKCYETEIREFPHIRSPKAIYAKSQYWGSKSGLKNAEAFKIVRKIDKA